MKCTYFFFQENREILQFIIVILSLLRRLSPPLSFTGGNYFSSYLFNWNSLFPGLSQIALISFLSFFFLPRNILSESFYSKSLQRQTSCFRESSNKTIKLHNTRLVLNNSSYLKPSSECRCVPNVFRGENKRHQHFFLYILYRYYFFTNADIFIQRQIVQKKNGVQFHNLVNFSPWRRGTPSHGFRFMLFRVIRDSRWTQWVHFAL